MKGGISVNVYFTATKVQIIWFSAKFERMFFYWRSDDGKLKELIEVRLPYGRRKLKDIALQGICPLTPGVSVANESCC